MKKIMLFIFSMVLMGCQATSVEPTQNVKQVLIEEKETIQTEIRFADQTLIDFYIKEGNKKTNIIELEYLHDQMIDSLLSQVNLELAIEDQSDIIQEIVEESLYKWKSKIIRDLIQETGDVLPEDDIQTIILRTSTDDAYQIMLAYEKIFLRNYSK